MPINMHRDVEARTAMRAYLESAQPNDALMELLVRLDTYVSIACIIVGLLLLVTYMATNHTHRLSQPQPGPRITGDGAGAPVRVHTKHATSNVVI